MIVSFQRIIVICFLWILAVKAIATGPARNAIHAYLERRQVDPNAITQCETTCGEALKTLDNCSDHECLCSKNTVSKLLDCGNCAYQTGDSEKEEIQQTLNEVKAECATKTMDVGNVQITATPLPATSASSSAIRLYSGDNGHFKILFTLLSGAICFGVARII
ncbi:hypothetical protein FRC03_009796 [Tulasnella sp. 419]|nr:hypothetical protein FRC03_009796 [Tulasnella sp. 419]